MSSDTSRGEQTEEGSDQKDQAFSEFKRYFHVLRPVFRLMGIHAETPDRAFEELGRLPEDIRPSISVEDARKAHFAQRGWILYKYPKSDLVHDALHHMEEGRFDEAEQILVGHFDDNTITQNMKRLERSTTFQRMAPIAQKALWAHTQGRRQESIPYTLALTDRLVHHAYLDHHDDAGDGPTKDTQARAWDAFAEATVGLKELKEYAKAGRRRDRTADQTGLIDSVVQLLDDPSTDALTVAKAWAAAFSAGEWALRLERSKERS